jgi:hypothetical protein
VTGLAARILRPPPPADAPPWLVTRLAKAERMIDLGWSVAALWGVVRAAAALWLGSGGGVVRAEWFADPALTFALAYGLYRRSRACAVLLLVYVVVELWIAFHVTGRPGGLGPALLLEVSFLTGLRGTLLYRRAMEKPDGG